MRTPFLLDSDAETLTPPCPNLAVPAAERTRLAGDPEFFEWAAEQWPAPRWSVEVDPWQLSPAWPQ